MAGMLFPTLFDGLEKTSFGTLAVASLQQFGAGEVDAGKFERAYRCPIFYIVGFKTMFRGFDSPGIGSEINFRRNRGRDACIV